MGLRRNGLVDGRQVKAARAILGLSQASVAELTGVNRNTVYRIEGLEAPPRYCRAGDKIAGAMGPLGIVFDGEDGEVIVRFKVEAADR